MTAIKKGACVKLTSNELDACSSDIERLLNQNGRTGFACELKRTEPGYWDLTVRADCVSERILCSIVLNGRQVFLSTCQEGTLLRIVALSGDKYEAIDLTEEERKVEV
jgi:hypothetical protein